MFTRPTRAAPALAATATATVPLAEPLCADVIAIQVESLVAVQVQPASVATSTESRPPPDAIASPARLNVNTQGAAAWFSDTPCEPTMTIAERADGTGFGATV